MIGNLFAIWGMIFLAAIVPEPPKKAAPITLTRAASDAWNYNRLQRTVLESQRDRINAELGRLEIDRNEINVKLKADFQVDAISGDTWDEKTLEIHRRTPQ